MKKLLKHKWIVVPVICLALWQEFFYLSLRQGDLVDGLFLFFFGDCILVYGIFIFRKRMPKKPPQIELFRPGEKITPWRNYYRDKMSLLSWACIIFIVAKALI